MTKTDSGSRQPYYFSAIHWLRSPIPVQELDGKKCLFRVDVGHNFPREAVFTLEARAHSSFPEFHFIQAKKDFYAGNLGRAEVIAFDQQRANQLRRSERSAEYEFVAEIDIRVPLERVPEIEKVVEQHILKLFGVNATTKQ